MTYDTQGRIKTLKQQHTSVIFRTTTIDYNTDHTSITDEGGRVTKLYYDSGNRLTKVEAHGDDTADTPLTTLFEYYADGNIKKITNALNQHTNYKYDDHGNITEINDTGGNVTTRLYDDNNNLIRETRTGSNEDGKLQTLVTRYVYDAENHLRYSISADGNVVRYSYRADGLVLDQFVYTDHEYDGGTGDPSLANMDAWLDSLANPPQGPGLLASTQITRHYYDARGNLTRIINYGDAEDDGIGGNASEGSTSTWFTYDQSGLLLNKRTETNAGVSYIYDGMGRMIETTDIHGGITSITFNDIQSKTVISLSSGLLRTSTYNRFGELISVVEVGDGVTDTSTYEYDDRGQLRLTTDATEREYYTIYDEFGRVVADINSSGHITEYKYDKNGRVIASVELYCSHFCR